jgi:hypothetical protein
MTDDTASTAIDGGDLEEIRALFLRQAAGETAHDIELMDAVLARARPGQPGPVNFVARAYCFWVVRQSLIIFAPSSRLPGGLNLMNASSGSFL